MDSQFFIDADTHSPHSLEPARPALRAGLMAPLAGLVAAVALFVTTLSVVAESQEAQALAAPTPQIPSEPLMLANVRE